MKYLRRIFILILGFCLPALSYAWGMLGHRITGEIAESYLSEKARTEVRRILGNESLAMASTWADFIRSDSSFRYLNNWHYINFKKGLEYTELVQALESDTSVNAYTRINFLVSELKKKTNGPETERIYLRLLVHLVGDVHQPLHVSPEGTLGGNTVKVLWFNQPSNLHRVWDEQLVEFQQLSFTEHARAINFASTELRQQWQKQPLSQWLYESYVVAQDLHEEIRSVNPKLGYDYNFKHAATMNRQLLKAGVRLAGMLNEIFG